MMNERLDLARQQFDEQADEAIDMLLHKGGMLGIHAFLHQCKYNQQLLAEDFDPCLKPLAQSIQNFPEWVQPKKIKQASLFFERNLSDILHILGFYSLPYCYAAADGARVLVKSKKITENPEKRLKDTAEFVLDILSKNAFEPSGKGFASLLKTRLIHSFTRKMVLQSGKWDTRWGLPVNQEDQAGTLLSFSWIVLLGLQKLGKAISSEEKEAWIHFWAVMGHQLGIADDLIPKTISDSIQLEKSIRLRHFKASEHGQFLSKVLLDYYQSQNLPGIPKSWTQAQMAYLLGPECSELLGIKADESIRKSIPYSIFSVFLKSQMGSDSTKVKVKMAERGR